MPSVSNKLTLGRIELMRECSGLLTPFFLVLSLPLSPPEIKPTILETHKIFFIGKNFMLCAHETLWEYLLFMSSRKLY